jgi:hypothetical protein
VIEQNGKQLSGVEQILVTKKNITAKVVIKDLNSLRNVSYSWFIDDISFKPSLTPAFTYQFDYPKVYKVMVVILANDTKQETNKVCSSRIGIISRKVNVIQQNTIKTSDDKDLTILSIRNKKRLALEGENHTIYGALIIGGAILLTLVFISIIIHTISICDKWLFNKNELKRPLIDQNFKMNRFYTP